jgi:hypothetical protein
MKVIEWAQARKIIPRSTPVAQARKTVEESAELLEAGAVLHTLHKVMEIDPDIVHMRDFQDLLAEWKAKYRDAAGDTLVTLVNGCALADVDLVDCFYESFLEIKDRRGTLMPNGVFVKE